MKPQLLFGSVMAVVAGFSVFEVATALAGLPSPLYAGHTIVAHLYDYAFIRFEMGYAATVAVILFLWTFGLGPDLDAPLLVQERILRSGEGLGAISWLLLPNARACRGTPRCSGGDAIPVAPPAYWLLIPLAIFAVLPIIYVISTAFKPLEELLLFPPPSSCLAPRWTTSRTSSWPPTPGGALLALSVQ